MTCPRCYTKIESGPVACPECGGQMAFNDFPERYFSFLSQG